MSGNSTEPYNHISGYNIDPRLAEWSQIRLAPIRDDHSLNHNQGPLPYISPYATDIYPEYTSPLDAQKCAMTGYSLYEGPQHAYMFYNDENSQRYTSSPTNSRNAETSPPLLEQELKQSTGDAVARYQARLEAINGVVIPSRNAPNDGSPKPSSTSSHKDPSANHICPVCGKGYSQKYEVACHFLACVDRHGNPHGVCWDDCSSLLLTGQSQQVITQTATPHQIINPTPRSGPNYESARKKKFNDRLNAVNGVIIPVPIPPKLPATGKGKKPSQTQSSSRSRSLQLVCPLCKSRFGKRDHVRSHFVACVDRNGNPGGLRWDDGLPRFRRGPRGPMGPREK